MQIGYVLYEPDTLKVLCLTKGKRAVELLDIKDTEKLNRALCLKDLTSIKDLNHKNTVDLDTGVKKTVEWMKEYYKL